MTTTTLIRPAKVRAGDFLVRDGAAHRVETVEKFGHKRYAFHLANGETVRVHANEKVEQA